MPILMLTALADPADYTAGLDIGADDYLAKPFKFQVLLARLRALLRRGPARLPPVLRHGSLALDPAQHRCSKNGADLDLTPREFAVLRYLMAHAGSAVGKQELLDHIWGKNDAADHNVVQVYISSLRRKIDARGEDSLVETVRGVGYRMCDAGLWRVPSGRPAWLVSPALGAWPVWGVYLIPAGRGAPASGYG